jgi:hypothetical protein
MTALEASILAAFKRYHVRAQVTRFLTGFVLTLVATLAAGTPGSVQAVGPVAVAAAWTVAREVWPTIPWPLVQAELRKVESHARPASTLTAPASGPPSAAVYEPVTAPDPPPPSATP